MLISKADAVEKIDSKLNVIREDKSQCEKLYKSAKSAFAIPTGVIADFVANRTDLREQNPFILFIC